MVGDVLNYREEYIRSPEEEGGERKKNKGVIRFGTYNIRNG